VTCDGPSSSLESPALRTLQGVRQPPPAATIASHALFVRPRLTCALDCCFSSHHYKHSSWGGVGPPRPGRRDDKSGRLCGRSCLVLSRLCEHSDGEGESFAFLTVSSMHTYLLLGCCTAVGGISDASCSVLGAAVLCVHAVLAKKKKAMAPAT